MDALSDTIKGNHKKTKIMKLKTFHTQICDEIVALLRMTQIAESGADVGHVDIVNFIGKHECSTTSPSLFTDDGTMRNKIFSVSVLKDDTNISDISDLPVKNYKTAVIVDAMHMIRE